MRVVVTILTCLFLQACASSGKPYSQTIARAAATPINPLDASVQIYIPTGLQQESFSLSFVKSEKVTITPGMDLNTAAFDVSEQMFTKTTTLDFDKKANFIIKLNGKSDLSYDGPALVKGVLTAELMDMDGVTLYSAEVTREQKTASVSENAYYDLYSSALKSFYAAMMKDNKRELIKHLRTHQASSPNLSALVKNETLDLSSTGTGFFVNKSGNVVTNDHVVSQCVAITVLVEGSSYLSRLVKTDRDRDIAILSTGHKTQNFALFNANTKGERLGENVLALGYPLHGVLSSSINLTTGNISSMLGVKDDENVYQITAPIQAGNSGGPVINQRGLVAGVVQSKLNALELSRFTGDLAQNVNFAIKSAKIKTFLSDNKISYHTRAYSDVHDRTTVDLADEARGYTVQIKCHG